jgi:hypothetical protein
VIDASENGDELDRTPAVAILVAAALVVIAASWGYLTDGRAPYGDDNSAHLSLMMHIAELWRAGVTDLWWNQSNLGLPLFMAYQPLPGLVSGTVGALFADTAARITVFKSSIAGLWALMPAAWYLGARWLGCDRTTALIFGLLTLAIRDTHDVGFGFTAATYGGLYTQIWGMFFFPATVGAFKRYVVDRRLPLVVPVALFVVVSMSHLFCGMYAGIATLTMVVVSGGARGERAWRAMRVYLPALALLAFWLGPLLATSDLIGGLPWRDEYYNGWPAVELFDHLLGGDVFDSGRLPWLTVLCFLGVVWTVERRRRLLDDWALVLGAVSVVLLMGRTNFGGWYDMLPMHSDVNVMRYLNAVHFCGLLFAAAAGRRLLELGRDWLPERRLLGRLGAAMLAGIALVGGYAVDRYLAFEETLDTFDQGHPNVTALVDHLSDKSAQRFAVDDQLNTSPHFFRDLLPALADRGQLQSYALGYHATLSTYYADYIEWESRAWARLFNVGTFVAREPFDETVVQGMEKAHEQGPYRTYTPGAEPEWGYFDFVRTPVAVEGGYHAIRPGVRELLVPAFERRLLPVLRGPTERSRKVGGPVLTKIDAKQKNSGAKTAAHHDEAGDGVAPDDPAEWSTWLERHTADAPIASEVLETSRGRNWYAAEVRAAGGGERLLLKANYFPFWRATVDGESAGIDHVAPNFMAIDVPAGRHEVRFTYRNPWWQKLGFVATFLVLCGWGGWTWRRRSA